MTSHTEPHTDAHPETVMEPVTDTEPKTEISAEPETETGAESRTETDTIACVDTDPRADNYEPAEADHPPFHTHPQVPSAGSSSPTEADDREEAAEGMVYEQGRFYDPWQSDDTAKKRREKQQGKRKPLIITAVCLAFLALIIITAIFTDGPASDINIDLGSGFKLPSFGRDPDPKPSATPGATDKPESVPEQEIPRASVGSGVTLDITPLDEDAGELSYQEIYRQCSQWVAGIEAVVDSRSYFWGTGVVMTPDGYVITNSHVIEESVSVTVILEDGGRYEAELVGKDALSDLAVLKIDAENLPYAEFGDSSVMEVGDGVVAIGNPLGEEFRGTLTHGIVSAIDRDVDYKGYTMTLIQTNAAINEGNSGGPLFNMHGQVIGITNMKMMSFYSSIEGIGFAIPTSGMKDVIDELIESGAVIGRPVIGISVYEYPPETVECDLPLDIILYISDVDKQSDAYRKGVRPGDILLAVNGTEVFSSREVNEIKNQSRAGDEMELSIYREGEYLDITIVLDDYSQLNG